MNGMGQATLRHQHYTGITQQLRQGLSHLAAAAISFLLKKSGGIILTR